MLSQLTQAVPFAIDAHTTGRNDVEAVARHAILDNDLTSLGLDNFHMLRKLSQSFGWNTAKDGCLL